jgi:hypothetical protein
MILYDFIHTYHSDELRHQVHSCRLTGLVDTVLAICCGNIRTGRMSQKLYKWMSAARIDLLTETEGRTYPFRDYDVRFSGPLNSHCHLSVICLESSDPIGSILVLLWHRKR